MFALNKNCHMLITHTILLNSGCKFMSNIKMLKYLNYLNSWFVL